MAIPLNALACVRDPECVSISVLNQKGVYDNKGLNDHLMYVFRSKLAADRFAGNLKNFGSQLVKFRGRTFEYCPSPNSDDSPKHFAVVLQTPSKDPRTPYLLSQQISKLESTAVYPPTPPPQYPPSVQEPDIVIDAQPHSIPSTPRPIARNNTPIPQNCPDSPVRILKIPVKKPELQKVAHKADLITTLLLRLKKANSLINSLQV